MVCYKYTSTSKEKSPGMMGEPEGGQQLCSLSPQVRVQEGQDCSGPLLRAPCSNECWTAGQAPDVGEPLTPIPPWPGTVCGEVGSAQTLH